MSEDCDSRPSAGDDEPPQPGPAGILDVEVIEMAGDWRPIPDASGAIEAAARAASAFPEAGLAGCSVAIALSDDAEVARLNETYRGKAAPTNVLSFPAPSDTPSAADDEPRFIGDIVVAAETVSREAQAQGTPPRDHLQHLTVHGLLHLAGFDHEDDAGAERMEQLEVRILASLGIADPYAEPPLQESA